MITVQTSKSFEAAALSLMDENAYDRLIEFLARNYLNGDIIPGTGGVRKIRYARQGKGKSAGFRVIYYYHSEGHPIVPFTIFAKNQKTNLSEAEKTELYKIVQMIKKELSK
ncbi:MAG: type II toxin-antitoxin system RelE/ParE family toxin [Nitrospira sp.]|nr:type II toxin-antitoxin system RelE/ParE family toxin [Nitrospira sp.]